jgi:2-oxoglutarate dehydrogenase E1 component
VSALDAANLAYLEPLYDRYQADPTGVDPRWSGRFRELESARPIPVGPDGALRHAPGGGPGGAATRLLEHYRFHGHLQADLDPLGLAHRPGRPPPPDSSALKTLRARLESAYCGTIGVEMGHLDDAAVVRWVAERMERPAEPLPLEVRRRILAELTRAETFERFLAAKFPGAKRFSLEGAEGLIPLLEAAIVRASGYGVLEIVLGMAHRGRLNVLANVLQKPVADILAEFREETVPETGGGDVKYHLGHSSDRRVDDANIHLSLCFNPSHLEFVDPVVQGRVRAKQDRIGDRERKKGLALTIHGDAAFIGQGVAAETLNLSLLPGYRAGGTVHVVVNNQLGFTTPPELGRSSIYCTDAARLLEVPIFHVNGDDPEAIVRAAAMAVDFRQAFGRDVVIDLWCYRRHGHNEGDEPSFTQPLMYRAIAGHPSVRERYARHLVEAGDLADGEPEALGDGARAALDQALGRTGTVPSHQAPAGVWAGYRGGPLDGGPPIPTAAPRPMLETVAGRITAVPANFTLHPKLARILERRREMGRGERPLDWGMAEALALGSLAWDGVRVRLTGQDTRRGTFSHRHDIWVDQETGAEHFPLSALREGQGPVEVLDSPLSEAGALGFEWGYSLDAPEALVIWEAQFGDFVNAAQVVVDQFICSAEAKWNRLSGIVLLLPHGMEGQGPEHSSARLERFLELCVEDNLRVVNLTTPAQLFHALRRQVLDGYRKPLVVMSPKSLLRHPASTSPLDELAQGGFRRVIPDDRAKDGAQAAGPADKVRRVLLCSGKVYFDLLEAREEKGLRDVHLIRLEQLYPLRHDELLEALSVYRDGIELVWVQEEPRNMGAWRYLDLCLSPLVRNSFRWSCLSRPNSASPAAGSPARHKLEQRRLVDAALTVEDGV